jgi:hypothetical protein
MPPSSFVVAQGMCHFVILGKARIACSRNLSLLELGNKKLPPFGSGYRLSEKSEIVNQSIHHLPLDIPIKWGKMP